MAALDVETSSAMLRNIEPWLRPTFDQVRSLVMSGDMLVLAPQAEGVNGRVAKMFGAMPDGFDMTITAGRSFDLGHLPNEVIKIEAKRGCELFEAGHIGHPFSEPYVLYHTWEQGGSLLLVDAMDWHKATHGHFPPGTFMVCEAQPVKIGIRSALIIGDIAHVSLDSKTNRYFGFVERNALAEMVPEDHRSDGAEALGNLAEPVMAAMLLLATDGVAVEKIDPPAKLNKARVKARKAAIPSHWRVATEGYVTALSQRGKRRSEPGNGHHASPIPHLRRGHVRNLSEYHGGGKRWIRDALINLKDPDAPLARSFYAMRQEATQR
jgi:hypothetical protein